jgi:hypothetical protein
LSGSSRDLTYQLDAPDSKLASSVLVESGPVQDKQRDTTMLKEYHYDHLVRWPRGERAAVFLTFDFQGGEDVKPDKNGILNYEMWSQGEYGPHHAIYRLLRILKEENITRLRDTCHATKNPR